MTKRTKAERREEAEIRQTEYDALTTAEKLARLPRCGNSKKEIARLEAKV